MGWKINFDTIKKKQEMKELKELSKLIYKVDYIDKLTWKDRAKQYAVQLGISVGTILLVLGAYHLITYLIK
ncbi:hypothetical protein ACTQ4K_04225 [Clostridium sporogenes]|uniref:hypothetical protein n=1 Tax=Clostridium sporogenes TaxID=1509 RepID=UPI003F8E4972